MFATIGRSWRFAKISYGIIWDFKSLIVFPLLSTAAGLVVLASFVAPLWGTGTLEQWMQMLGGDGNAAGAGPADQVLMYATLLAFYFCSYFVIVFFNVGLTACAMRVIGGESPTVGYGLSIAAQRLPQIAGWALVAAVVGVLLRAIENINEKAGRFIAALLGTAWTVMTYFVVPVLVVEGVGPFGAIRRSLGTLRSTWGEALVGNISMGLLAFLIMLPVLLVLGVIVVLAIGSGNNAAVFTAIGVGVVLIIVVGAATSAADVVFKALLYNHATGRSVPADIDSRVFAEAFRTR